MTTDVPLSGAATFTSTRRLRSAMAASKLGAVEKSKEPVAEEQVTCPEIGKNPAKLNTSDAFTKFVKVCEQAFMSLIRSGTSDARTDAAPNARWITNLSFSAAVSVRPSNASSAFSRAFTLTLLVCKTAMSPMGNNASDIIAARRTGRLENKLGF